MSNYTQITDFSAKDSLTTGDPNKLIKGSDVDAEFDAISTAIATKEDTTNKGANDGYASLDSSGDVPSTQLPAATTTVVGALETATDTEAKAVTATDKIVTPGNLSAVLAEPPAIGGTTAAAGTFTTGTITTGNITTANITTLNVTNAPNLPSGSQVNSSNILTVADEGSGNGIDADTVDSLEATSFLRSDTADTVAGVLTFSVAQTLNNNIVIQAKEAGGTTRNMIKMSASDVATFGNDVTATEIDGSAITLDAAVTTNSSLTVTTDLTVNGTTADINAALIADSYTRSTAASSAEEGLTTVILDTPEEISASLTSNAWTTVNNTTLGTAGAVIALLKSYISVAVTSGTPSPSATTTLYAIKNGETQTLDFEQMMDRVVAEFAGGSDVNVVHYQVPLDSGSDFQYYLQTSAGGATTSHSGRMHLVGYMV